MMKSIALLASIALSSAALAYEYEGPVTNFPPTSIVGSPFAVANSAYNGELEGIPGFASFCSGVIAGDITASEIATQAAAQGLTTREVNSDFIRAVGTQVRGICAQN